METTISWLGRKSTGSLASSDTRVDLLRRETELSEKEDERTRGVPLIPKSYLLRNLTVQGTLSIPKDEKVSPHQDE